jgi:hypothetical protein
MVFGPLLLLGLFIPLLLNQALGEMPARRAGLWALIAAATIVALGIYDLWSAWPVDWSYGSKPVATPHILPSPRLFIFCASGLFIAHALVVGAGIDRRFQARYTTHFDVAWKQAVQLALTAAFVGAFWLLLVLGANLFALIKLEFFRRLLEHQWFSIPVTTLAVAGALHLTDIRPALVRGVRTLGLTLLSWLLPLITLIVAGFLLCLPVTGLAPLWAVGHASALLLAAAAVSVVLINAAHQDGDPERAPPRLLRWTGTLAAFLPLPLSGIAIYALALRVNQYGWTEDRVLVAAALLVAGFYALGYVRAAVMPGPWLWRVESWNFFAALLSLTVMILLSTPVADPRHVAVADQVARLKTDKVKPEAFDYRYLRWGSGRYGQAALQELSQSKTVAIREMASGALRQTARYEPIAAPRQTLAQRLTVYPAGQNLPTGFAETDWAKADNPFTLPGCLRFQVAPCDAVIGDFDGDGQSDVMLIDVASVTLFDRAANGSWQLDGSLPLPPNCPSLRQSLRESLQRGEYRLEADKKPWKVFVIGGARLVPEPKEQVLLPPCPPTAH